MARFSMNDDLGQFNNGSQNRTNFLSLKNDNDMARVRFMYNDVDDIAVDIVHTVKVNDKDRFVSCLRDYNSPVDDCPFCKAGMPIKQQVYFYVYDVDTNEVKVWQRSATFAKSLIPTLQRATRGGKPLCSTIFEVERHGAKGSKDTTYGVYMAESDNTTLDSLPEIPKIVGGIVMDKNANDMTYYLDEGEFPPRNGDIQEEDSQPVRRSQPRQEEQQLQPRRRTPSGTDQF